MKLEFTKFSKFVIIILVRRCYVISITVNNIHFEELYVDPHFEIKHSESMDDEIILALSNQLDGRVHDPIAVDRDGFRYYRTEPMYFKGKPYRLIWLIDPDESYLGVVNCYRRKKK